MESRVPYRGEQDHTEVGYRITRCGFEGCDWQQIDATDQEAFQHIVEEHANQLEWMWQFGRLEA